MAAALWRASNRPSLLRAPDRFWRAVACSASAQKGIPLQTELAELRQALVSTPVAGRWRGQATSKAKQRARGPAFLACEACN